MTFDSCKKIENSKLTILRWNMVAKFSTKNSAMDYFRYVRKNALLMIAFGLIFGIAGLAAGIAMLAVANNIPGGTVLLIVGILIATGLILYGLYGLKRQFLKNTLITQLETNITEFGDESIRITHLGEGIRAEKEYGYMHIARIVEDNESFQIELTNNTLVLCTKQSLIDGSEEALENFLIQKLGNKFINHCKYRLPINNDIPDKNADNNKDTENGSGEIVENHTVADEDKAGVDNESINDGDKGKSAVNETESNNSDNLNN